MFESLRSLSNSQIIQGSKSARAQEHGGMLSGLGYLVEIERRRIHLELGYSSLFEYCLHALGYSESQAQRRILVARCIVRFPDVFPMLEKNEVNLGTVARVSKLLTPGNCSTVLARIRCRSLREVEAIAAEYDPESAVPRDRIRTIVVRVPVKAAASTSQHEPALLGENHLRNDGKKSSSEPQELEFERRARVEFTADEELMAQLDRIRALAAHRLPAGASMAELLRWMAEYVLQREDPVVRQQRREQRDRPPKIEPSDDPRHIPAHVRDLVFKRDQSKCTFKSAKGKRCGSTHMLQIDHRVPVARGGKSTLDNLRLLCAHHNRLEAERLMGRCGPISAHGDRPSAPPN